MARGAKIKKIVGKRGVSYRTTVDVGTDPATGKRKQKVLTAKTRQEIETLVAQTLADVSRNVYFEPQKMTVGEYLDYWLKTHSTVANLEKTTFEKYETVINLHMKPAFGAIPVQKLAPGHVQQFIANQLENGLAPATVSLQYKVLKKSLKDAVRWEIVGRNVCDMVDSPKVPRVEVDPFTTEENNAIMAALKGTYHEKITFVKTHTGMRIGELLALKREDIHLDAKEPYLIVSHALKTLKGGVIVDGTIKGNRPPRQIDLVPEVVAVFKARFKEIAKEKLAMGQAYHDLGYVFAKEDGTPRSPRSYGSAWRGAVRRRTGIPAHIHRCRHTAATTMLTAGVSVADVAAVLGHTPEVTHRFYAHATPTGKREAVRKLAEALDGRK